MAHSRAKVAWNEVNLPKEEGGLGMKKIKEWNKANFVKLLWRLYDPSCYSEWKDWV